MTIYHKLMTIMFTNVSFISFFCIYLRIGISHTDVANWKLLPPVGQFRPLEGDRDADDDVIITAADENGDSADSISGGSRRASVYIRSKWFQICCCCSWWWWFVDNSHGGATRRTPVIKTI